MKIEDKNEVSLEKTEEFSFNSGKDELSSYK